MVQVLGAPELFSRVSQGTSAAVVAREALLPHYTALVQVKSAFLILKTKCSGDMIAYLLKSKHTGDLSFFLLKSKSYKHCRNSVF